MNDPQEPAAPPEVVRGRLSSYRFVIAALAFLLNVSFGLSFFATSPVTPLIIEEYGVNRSTASLLTSLVILMQALFAVPASMLVGRVPLKKLIAVGWLMLAAPALSFLAVTFPVLLAIRIVYGLSFAILLPALGPLLMQWFRPRELPLINGLNLAVATLGIATSGFIATPVAEALGWKLALSMFGLVSLAGAGCWLLLGRTADDRPMERGGVSLKEAWRLIRTRTALLLAIADAGPYAQYTALMAWLPTFYFEVHGMSLSRAGAAVGVISLCGSFALIAAGLLSMRISRRRPFLLVPGVIVGLAGFGSFLLAGSTLVYIPLVLLGFASWFYLPALLTIPMEIPGLAPEQVSMVWAILIALGSTLSFVSPLAVGAITDATGTYLLGFSLFAVLAGSLAVGGFLLPETAVSREASSG